MYAYVVDGTIQATGRLPAAARRLDTQQWVLGLADAPVELQQACGWYAVTDTARPDDTPATTHDRTVTLVDGTPTVVWTERPKTQAELDAEADAAQRQAEQDALPAAARLTVVDKVKADALTDEQVLEIAPLFDPLTAGTQVATGDVYRWDGTLVEAIQPHTVEGWWLDLAALPPSLYKVHRTDDGTGPIPWQTGISLTTDDQVWYGDILYDVLQGHTTQTGWEPPNVPNLFTPADVS